MKHLYIDTNIYLSFFHLTNDDLEELKKLILLIGREEIVLHLPEQTFDEFYRNREVKIADALKRFKEEKLNNQIPSFCKDYQEYKVLKKATIEYNTSKQKLLKILIEDIESRNLIADKLITELFAKAVKHDITTEIVEISRFRFDVGRPPGKNKSYGDAINWETLLSAVPYSEDLYFISEDGDFYSDINSERFNDYLLEEWKGKINSDLIHYKKISLFFKENYPEIKFNLEYEKEILLKDLLNSNSFAYSRNRLYELSRFDDFSIEQLETFINACISNNQIYWIRKDKDIKEIISKIIELNKDKISPQLIYDLKNTEFID